MPLETERCRHGAVAIPIVAVTSLVSVGTGQQRPRPKQPNLPYRQATIRLGGASQPLHLRVGFVDVGVGTASQQ